MEKDKKLIPQLMSEKDVSGVVYLHTLCFPEQLTTGLGKSFLIQLYRRITRDDHNIGVVLKFPHSNDVQGFAVSTIDSQLEKHMIFAHPFLSLLGVIRGIFTSPAIRDGIYRRLKPEKKQCRSDSFPNPDTPLRDLAHLNVTDEKEAYFLYVAIHPDFRGSGNAERMVRYFEEQVFQTGAKRITGAVYPDNLASLIMYKRLGWRVQKTSPTRFDVWTEREE